MYNLTLMSLIEVVLLKVVKFIFPVDFVMLDVEALIDVNGSRIVLSVGNEEFLFKLLEVVRQLCQE